MVYPPAYAPEKRNFALKTDFSLGDLEGGLVRVGELNRSLDGTDGCHALAVGFIFPFMLDLMCIGKYAVAAICNISLLDTADFPCTVTTYYS